VPAWHKESRNYKVRPYLLQILIFINTPPLASDLAITMLRFTSLAVLSGLVSFVLADAQIPYYPNVTDPNFPLGSRCIDYCAFLNPRQICPGHPLDVNCLCEVYNERLPPVFTPLRNVQPLIVVSTMLGCEERHGWQ
jgi:hypothetical protein